MTVEEMRHTLESAGFRIESEKRLRNDSGTQLRLDDAVVNVYDKGTFQVQGKNRSAVEEALSVTQVGEASATYGTKRKVFVGELGFYLVGDGTNVAWRARCRPPSFIHFATFPHLIEGHTLSDIVAVLGSLNIIAAELDR